MYKRASCCKRYRESRNTLFIKIGQNTINLGLFQLINDFTKQFVHVSIRDYPISKDQLQLFNMVKKTTLDLLFSNWF